MISKYIKHKNTAIRLRRSGYTYGEIVKKIDAPIPKSTLSIWFQNIKLSAYARKRLENSISDKLKKAHAAALLTNKKKRQEYLRDIEKRVSHLKNHLSNKDVAKIVLAVLYLGEGKKSIRRSFMFGNSDPKVIKLYLNLLRKCYAIDESKFRCTVQCRADQDVPFLEKFWLDVTKIPASQFYRSRIDPRTIGKKSKKPQYKGVCRIDYFCADIYNEIEKIIEIVCKMGL